MRPWKETEKDTQRHREQTSEDRGTDGCDDEPTPGAPEAGRVSP